MLEGEGVEVAVDPVQLPFGVECRLSNKKVIVLDSLTTYVLINHIDK